jgi:hypothetical protein
MSQISAAHHRLKYKDSMSWLLNTACHFEERQQNDQMFYVMKDQLAEKNTCSVLS